MTENQQVGLVDAAKRKGMTLGGFRYYVESGSGPKSEKIAGRLLFWTDELDAWTPNYRRRPKDKK